MRTGTCFIANPNAGSIQLDAIKAWVEANPHAELRETKAQGDGRILAAKAREDGFACVVAVGGDGTVTEVVNGLADGPDGVVLGIIPCGTGNDLCRTLGIPLDPVAALALLEEGEVRKIDLFRATFRGQAPLWGVNMAVGGVAGEIGDRVDPDAKKRWGPLAFVGESIKVALEEIPKFDLKITADGEVIEPGELVAAVVGNGRTCGGGRHASPRSNPEDGLLDLVLVQSGSVLDVAGMLARLVAGDYTRNDLVTHRTAKHLKLESSPPMGFNLDGEFVGTCPVEFEVVPGVLGVIVGPGYNAVPKPVQREESSSVITMGT